MSLGLVSGDPAVSCFPAVANNNGWNMNLIDTHSHIYLKENFGEDLELVVERLKQAGVEHVFLPNVDSSTIDEMHELEAAEPDRFHALMGLHPTSVKENFREELDVVARCLKERDYCGVGEIGIDLYWDKTFVKEQAEAFETQVDLAISRSLPIVIHCREAFPEIVASLRKFDKTKLRGIFHSFGGSADDVEVISSLGDFWLGINGVVTFKKSTLPDVLENVPLERLVLETDSPYLTPVPHRGKRNETAYIVHTAQKIAEIKGVSVEFVAQCTAQNAKKIFEV